MTIYHAPDACNPVKLFRNCARRSTAPRGAVRAVSRGSRLNLDHAVATRFPSVRCSATKRGIARRSLCAAARSRAQYERRLRLKTPSTRLHISLRLQMGLHIIHRTNKPAIQTGLYANGSCQSVAIGKRFPKSTILFSNDAVSHATRFTSPKRRDSRVA